MLYRYIHEVIFRRYQSSPDFPGGREQETGAGRAVENHLMKISGGSLLIVQPAGTIYGKLIQSKSTSTKALVLHFLASAIPVPGTAGHHFFLESAASTLSLGFRGLGFRV